MLAKLTMHLEEHVYIFQTLKILKRNVVHEINIPTERDL